MNLKMIILGIVVLFFGFGYLPVFAGLTHEAEHHGQAANVASTEAIEVGNKICPVSKEKVGQMGKIITHEYNGKIYNLCCAMCAKDFKKDPEKYSKIAEEEAAKE